MLDFNYGNTTFHYRSDLSGEVIIEGFTEDNEKVFLEVPGQAILDFLAEYIKMQRIKTLEFATTNEILSLER